MGLAEEIVDGHGGSQKYSEEELRQIAMVGDPYQPKQPAGYMGTWHTRSRGGAPKFGGEPTKWNYVTGFWDVK